MGANTIQAQYDQLEAIAGRFAQSGEASADLRQRLARSADALTTDGWEGRGAAAFAAEMSGEVLPALQRLVQALEIARAVTLVAKATLRAAEEEAARPFGGEAHATAATGTGTGAASATVTKGGLDGGPSKVVQPRVYIVNGINSDGNVPGARDANGNPIFGDNESVATEQLLERYGYDPDQVKSTSAIYTKPKGTNLTGTALTGTHLGGWLSPVDWLTGGAAAVVNTVTDAGADTINAVTKAAAEAPGVSTLYGGGEVAAEYLRGEQGKYTRQVYNEIAADLRDNPLVPGQTVILMGHSGGGAVTANMAGMLERNLGVDVSGMVTMGSPLSNYDEAKHYVETIADVRHTKDWVVNTMPFRGDPDGSSSGPSPGRTSTVANITLRGATDYAHGSYMHDDPGVSQDMVRALSRLYPEMNLQIAQ